MDFTLVGVPYDKTQTFRKGSARAPDMIRSIFPKLETYINSVDLTEHFVEDLGNVSKEELKELKIKSFPIILGGEHTITRWAVEKIKPKNVVILDAHPDCEDSGKHDGISRQLADAGFKVYLYGVRTISKQENEYLKKGKVKIAKLSDLKKLKDIYLSIDLDVLDPSILPAVGNPEPDGLRFKEAVDIIRSIAKNLIAVDFVEYTPTEKDNDIYLSIAGKLIYSVMAEIVKKSGI